MSRAQRRPPRWAEWILVRSFPVDMRETILSDFEDQYVRFDEQGIRTGAHIWTIVQVFKILKGKLLNRIYWSGAMLNHHIKIMLRNLRKSRGFTALNILGLTIGLACFILIMLYIRHELSYDAFHAHADRLFRVACQLPGERYGMGEDMLAITPAPLAPGMKETFPEVDASTRFSPRNRFLLTMEDTHFYERGLFADPHFFDVFSFELIRGDKARVLENLESIVISRRLAEKFFGSRDPIGKTLECSLGDLTVTGITADLPENSHIQFDWLIPFALQFSPEDRERRLNKWNWDDYYTYVKLSDASQTSAFEEKLHAYTKKVYRAADVEWGEIRAQFRHFLQPMKRIHLTSGFKYEFALTSDLSTIRMFSVIAVFILLIACVNAVNLNTARASKRTKEIGMRKVIGAQRRQLFRQFTGESLLISLVSLVLALGLVIALLPMYNRLIERSITVQALFHASVMLGLVLVGLLTGLLSGLYPALFLSSLKPVNIFRQRIGSVGRRMVLRNILVLLQFSTTIALMAAALVIFRQIRYIQNKDLGFNREQIVVMRRSDPGIRQNYTAFQNTLLQNPKVIEVTTSSQLPTNILSATGVPFQTDNGDERMIHYQWIGVDWNFLDVFDIEITQGRNFSKAFSTDEAGAIIINEKFLDEAGWANPIGKEFPPLWDGENPDKIVGVAKNIHGRSLHWEIKPMVIACRPNAYFLFARIDVRDVVGTLAFIEEVYDRFMTRYPFDYFFLDEQFDRMYGSEKKLGRMVVYFSGLAIFIACLGIIGLASHTAERRTKEIGIRKTLGASVRGILFLFTKEFTRWVLLANLIAWPAAFFIMQRWLQDFHYRIGLRWDLFLLSGLMALVIALISVGYQSLRAALARPVNSLRYE